MLLLECVFFVSTKRLTFDIKSMHDSVWYYGDDNGDYHYFIASNNYEVISRSRMDIQTERIWLLGGKTKPEDQRSGTMVFSDNTKRDVALENFISALYEWADKNNGEARIEVLS